MLRFVVAPDGSLVFDAAARLPGRGLWVAAAAAALARAIAKRCFARAARRSLVIPDDLASHVEGQLAARCIDTLGLARRAGTAVAGYEKVATALKRQAPGALLLASDAGDWARQKLGSTKGQLIETLISGELGQAFGRDKIVHVYVGPGALAEKLKIEAARLDGLRRNGVASVVPERDAI